MAILKLHLILVGVLMYSINMLVIFWNRNYLKPYQSKGNGEQEKHTIGIKFFVNEMNLRNPYQGRIIHTFLYLA